MLVKEFMLSKVPTASPEITISEAVSLMVKTKTNSLVVVDEGHKPIGTLSSYTLTRAVVPEYLKDPNFSQYGAEGTFDRYALKIKDMKIKEIMHTNFHILKADDAIIEAVAYAVEASRRILPVVDNDGKLIGAITRTCIKNALYKAFNT